MNKVLVHEIIKSSEHSVRKAPTRQACLQESLRMDIRKL